MIHAHKRAGNCSHHALKRAQTVVVGALAAAAGHREVQLHAPVALVPGCLYGGDDGRVGHSLKGLGCILVVLETQCEYLVGRRNGARLVSVLPVQAQVEAFRHEYHAGRVAVHAVKADGCIACGVTKKINALVCVSENAAGVCRGGCCQQKAGQNLFCFHTLKQYLLKNGCKGKHYFRKLVRCVPALKDY